MVHDKVYIIAEAGVNHNGDISLAKQLIDVAADAGADAVKFQSFKAENIVSKTAKKAEYQIKNSGNNESQYEMIKRLELDVDAHQELIKHCEKRNITFLSTPFDKESIDLLIKLGLGIFKIPSGEITNLPHLEYLGSFNKDIILSTGMATLEEVNTALQVLIKAGSTLSKIIILHANTDYPTAIEDVNLRAMLTIGNELKTKIGYSDHTLGIEVATAAVALGASVIEKHFTLSREMEGPDHKASLEPDELKQMIVAIRNIENAMGSFVKKPSPSEQKNIDIARKSIHISESLKAGDEITERHLSMKRPGDGISPMLYKRIIGKKAKKDIAINHKLSWEDVQ